jgi:hypothetical protein
MDVRRGERVHLDVGEADSDSDDAGAEPSAFFERFEELDYRTPAYAATLLRHVLGALSEQDNVIVDLGSSYGINAALINHAVSLPGLYAHYRRDGKATTAWRIEEDRRFFTATRRSDAVPVIGIDVSSSAINYGISVGLLVAGITSDLEHDRQDHDASVLLRRSTLISASNPVEFLGSRTFITLIGASAHPPVITGFFLRWRDVRPIAQSLAVAGYEFRADYCSVFPLRRFDSVADRRAAVSGLRRLGLKETAVETNGYHGAVPFVAIPRSLRQRAAVAAAMTSVEPPAW